MVNADMIGFFVFGVFALGIGVALYLSYRRAPTEAQKYVAPSGANPYGRVDKRYFVVMTILIAIFCFDASILDYLHPPHLQVVALGTLWGAVDLVCRIVLIADGIGCCVWVVTVILATLSLTTRR